jgi:cytochrome d ubiquinol oxidase subunit II
MTLVTALLALIWVSVTAYAVLAGADFGAGAWDLLAGTARSGRRQRGLIEHVIGPVWEANHVWLIFVLVLLWTCFPPAFAAIASTLYVPLTLVALGIIARGSAFAFRKAVTTIAQQRLFGAAFAASSVLTPFFLGATAGAIASDRVPAGIAAGGVLSSWLTPTSVAVGLLSVGACAFLAAVYLTADARRDHQTELTRYFRARALGSGIVTGLLSLVTLLIVRTDAAQLYHGLTHRAAPLMALAIAGGGATLALLWRRRDAAARVAAALAVAALLWGWGVAQYPQLLPGLSATQVAAVPATLRATAVVVVVGVALLIPALILLLALFRRPSADGHVNRYDS